ncbi:MAG: ABC transporter ATP-binding protein [Actinobacteria bacterium]|nr:ABC transporter ATP-binding protein [Actinomycetota bacterium]
MSVSLRGVEKAFAARSAAPIPVLHGIDLEVPDGEMIVIVGPSGSGKTTLLRCIAGLEELDRGSVLVGGRDVTHDDPGERDIAMVFQELALYPHLTVRANIAFGLKARKSPPAEVAVAVADVARTLELEPLLGRLPSELSGGERQRVALARAIVRDPTAFLLDEPLSNLDPALRTRARVEIRTLQRDLGRTAIYVTHDQVEAMTLGDRIAVLRNGRVEQVGAPLELYDHPASAFVGRFLGTPPMSILSSEVLTPDRRKAAAFGIRPERVRLADADGDVKATVEVVEHIGSSTVVHLRTSHGELLARTPGRDVPQPGETVMVSFADRDIRFFESEDGRAVTP